jgi:hypothetical protein
MKPIFETVPRGGYEGEGETAMKNGRIRLLDHGFVRLVDSMGDDRCVLPVSLSMQRGELAKIRVVISG